MNNDSGGPSGAPDSPNVITFPPVIFAAFYAIGYLCDRAYRIDLGANDVRHIGGGLMLVAGVFLATWSVARFIRARTHVDVRKPATALVTDGPYRLSRNPIYLAMALFYGGIAVIFSHPVALAFLLPCLMVLHYGVIRREELYLERTFGNAYRDYRKNTRRWL